MVASCSGHLTLSHCFLLVSAVVYPGTTPSFLSLLRLVLLCCIPCITASGIGQEIALQLYQVHSLLLLLLLLLLLHELVIGNTLLLAMNAKQMCLPALLQCIPCSPALLPAGLHRDHSLTLPRQVCRHRRPHPRHRHRRILLLVGDAGGAAP